MYVYVFVSFAFSLTIVLTSISVVKILRFTVGYVNTFALHKAMQYMTLYMLSLEHFYMVEGLNLYVQRFPKYMH